MADLTEDRLREIIREETSNKAPHRFIPISTGPSEAENFAAATAPAADPSAIRLDWSGGLASTLESPEAQQEVDAGLRQMAVAVGWPPHVAAGVLRQAIEDTAKFGAMSETAAAIWTSQQQQLLGRLVPGVSAEDIVAGANKILGKADAAFVARLRQSGALNSAGLLVNLYLQGQRDALRSAGR
jgi:hypothetical protein